MTITEVAYRRKWAHITTQVNQRLKPSDTGTNRYRHRYRQLWSDTGTDTGTELVQKWFTC